MTLQSTVWRVWRPRGFKGRSPLVSAVMGVPRMPIYVTQTQITATMVLRIVVGLN